VTLSRSLTWNSDRRARLRGLVPQLHVPVLPHRCHGPSIGRHQSTIPARPDTSARPTRAVTSNSRNPGRNWTISAPSASATLSATAGRQLNLSNERILLLSDDPPELLTDTFTHLNHEGYVCDAVPNDHLMPAREALSVLPSAKALVLATSTLSWWSAP